MIVSWNWLSQYVRLDAPVEALTERLSLAGLNHESTTEVGGDLAIDLEVTSNRPDCLNHIGVAREISVLFGQQLSIPDPKPRTAGQAVESVASVLVEDSELCPCFTARVVTGCRIGESPWWLRKRLETLGVKPISNVVDVTNYVMFECGQPLHAYDLTKVAGRRLIVRKARAGETLKAINTKVYELTSEMLTISDAERPVGLAGVMGGLETEIGLDSAQVLIEAALFDPVSVRKTSRSLGLASPSSYRFERCLDPERTEWASRRCAELILEAAGGTLHPGVIEVRAQAVPRAAITLRLDQIPRVLGITIERDTVVHILKALGLAAAGDSAGSLTFHSPSWRPDLEREIDLIEEVARIHGYDHIPENRSVPLARSTRGTRERVEGAVREALSGLGLDEAVTFSLVNDALAAPISPEAGGAPLLVEHSSRRLESALRQSLVPSLLAVRAHNEAHGNADAELFEIADVYLPRSDRALPDEPTRLSLVSGRDFLGLKGIVEAVVDRLHLQDELRARPASLAPFAAGRAAELFLGETSLGYLGEIDPSERAAFSLRGPCSAAELAFGVLMDRAVIVPRAHPLPPYPAVSRDLSLVVSKSLPWAELASAARIAAGSLLESITYFDTFSGSEIPADQHSLHFGLKFRRLDRTLTGEEVDRAVQAIVSACKVRCGAALRA
jgi:phenylalanyl-tRNA synthetase beta chain